MSKDYIKWIFNMLNKMQKIKRILEKMKNKYERKEQYNIKLREMV